jgi:diguanylate cyclase (GGDEF)-like protein
MFFILGVIVLFLNYKIEKANMLSFLAKETNQSLYHLEEHIRGILSDDRLKNIQALLEQNSIVNPAIKTLSLSFDDKIISYSSQKRLIGTLLGENYHSIGEITKLLKDKKAFRYKSSFTYYKDNIKHYATLYLDLDEDYIFDRFTRTALYYGISMVIIISIVMIFAVYIVRLLVLGPLESIAKQVKEIEPKPQNHFIHELRDLDFAVCNSINSLNEKQQELKTTLTIDSLTNLPNRYSLQKAISKKEYACLAILNIDRFADINEVYGNEIGDKTLIAYSSWLKDELNGYKNLEVFRLGSDEFALLCDGVDSIKFESLLHTLIQKTKDRVFKLDDIDVIFTVAIGMSHTSEKLLEHALVALKKAKQNSQSFNLFTQDISSEQEENIRWYKKLRSAIDNNRIATYYQPLVLNKTKEIAKHEALIRLIDEDGSVVSPFHFLDIAKKSKLSLELTRIVFDQVVKNIKTYGVSISINLSTTDILDTTLNQYMLNTIEKDNIGRFIVFEILESDGIENYKEVAEFIEKCQRIGCRFAVDDFGSGYSNFEHLIKLNIDILKIDASLIKNLPHDKNSQLLVKHISRFAKNMNIATVAEFVANEQIYNLANELGVTMSQGYYFYEPSPSIVTI